MHGAPCGIVLAGSVKGMSVPLLRRAVLPPPRGYGVSVHTRVLTVRWTVALALTACVVALVGLVAPNSALAAGATVSGTVYDVNNLHSAGVQVRLIDVGTDSEVAQTISGVAGYYEFSGIADGLYYTLARDDSAGTSYQFNFEVIGGVAEPAGPADLWLSGAPPMGDISGTVRAPDGTTVTSGTVTFYFQADSQSEWVAASTAAIESDGTYTAQLSAGQYKVSATDGTHLTTYHSGSAGVADIADALPVAVSPQLGLQRADITLLDPGSVSGTVTDSATTPLDGIEVIAYRKTAGDLLEQGRATVQAGSYTIGNLPAGDYVVWFSDPAGQYLSQAYKDVRLAAEPQQGNPAWDAVSALIQPVGLAFGEVKTGCDATLASAALISGKVSFADGSAAGHANVAVYAYDAFTHAWTWTADATTSETGIYSVGNLDPGTYRVEFAIDTYDLQYWPGKSTAADAGSIDLGSASSKSGVDAVFDAPAILTGTLTDPAGVGVAGEVSLYRKVGSTFSRVGGTACDALGEYSLPVAPGYAYYLGASDDPASPRFANVYFKTGGVSAHTLTAASPIQATPSVSGGPFDLKFSAAAEISGTISDARDGSSVDAVRVEAYASDGSVRATAFSDASGRYALVGLAVDSYYLRFGDVAAHLDGFYTGSETTSFLPSAAKLVPAKVTAPSTNVKLVAGTTISGTVKTAGAPLPDVSISGLPINPEFDSLSDMTTQWPRNATSAGNGTYVLDGIAPIGFSYQVSAAAPGVIWADMVYKGFAVLPYGSSEVQGYTPVKAGDANIDFELGRRVGRFSGSVVTADGSIPDHSLVAHLQFQNPGVESWAQVATTPSSANGKFEFADTAVLPPGTYRVVITDPVVAQFDATSTPKMVGAGEAGVFDSLLLRPHAPATQLAHDRVWQKSAVIEFDRTDSVHMQGQITTKFKLGTGGTTMTYVAGTSKVASQGVTTVEYWSVDSAGREESPHKPGEIWYDGIAPTVTASPADGSWTKAAVKVTLFASDRGVSPSGLKSLAYKVGTGSLTTTTAPSVSFSISAVGKTTVSYSAEDVAGNVSTGTITVGIDKTAPVVTPVLDRSTGKTRMTLIATDTASGSGLRGENGIQYQMGGTGAWAQYTRGPIDLGAAHKVNYKATDYAGNVATGTLQLAQESDSNLAYDAGSWAAKSSSAAGGDAYKYSVKAGAFVHVKFTGTSFELFGVKAKSFGRVRVTLDGKPRTINCYSLTSLYGTKLYASPSLPMGEHIAVIEAVDTKPVAVDFVSVYGPESSSLTNAKATWLENTALLAKTFYAWGGTWSTTYSSRYSGGSQRYTTRSGASFTMAFNGDGVRLLAMRARTQGRFRVTIDGGSYRDVSLYAASTATRQNVFTRVGLGNGPHVVTVQSLSTKPVSLDAVIVLGGMPRTLATRVEETKTVRSAGWITERSAKLSNGSQMNTTKVGSSYSFSFSDTKMTGFTLIGSRGVTYGKMSVSIDGGAAVTVDLYRSSPVYKAPLFASRGLAANVKHTVKVVALSKTVGLDAIDVFGTFKP